MYPIKDTVFIFKIDAQNFSHNCKRFKGNIGNKKPIKAVWLGDRHKNLPIFPCARKNSERTSRHEMIGIHNRFLHLKLS